MLGSVHVHAQSLVASNTSASTNQSNAPLTLAYTPGADSGSFDFELRYTTLATTAGAQVSAAIANGALACSLPAPGRLRCTVLAASAAADLGAGNITIVFATGGTTGLMPATFQSAHFFSQTGAVEAGSTTAGSLALVSTPTLTISDVSVVEGNAGTKLATFTVNLGPVSAGPVSYDIATDTGTAMPGIDYVAKSLVGQSIPAGQSSASFTVTINGDTFTENDESFTVNLRNVAGAAVGDAQALAKIVNDDSASLSIADASASEGNLGQATVRFQVTMSAPMPTPVTFNISTSDGSATAGSDYVARNQASRLLDVGRTSLIFEVAVNGDALAEPDETFTVTLSSVSGATLADGVATGTIVNDDGAALVPIARIQGSGPVSPLVGQRVSTEGVVTALTEDGFFLQTPDAERDGNTASAEGIAVRSADGTVVVGDRRGVEGIVQEVQVGRDPDQLTLTIIAATRAWLVEGGQPLPRPIVLDARVAGPNAPIDGLERFEGMRASIPLLDVIGPSTGSADQGTGAIRDTGRFFGVATGVARPFLQPGASVLDPEAAQAGTPSAQFDTNPERLRIDSTAQRGARHIAVDVGDRIAGLVGVLGYAQAAYQLAPDPGAAVVVTVGARPRAVNAVGQQAVSVATLSLDHDLEGDDDAQPLTGAAQAVQLAKAANAICAFAGAPDVVAVTGIAHPGDLAELAQAINARDGDMLFPGSCAVDPGYSATVAPGVAGGIGFLVRSQTSEGAKGRVEIVSITQADPTATQRRPDGSLQAVFDSPPLILEAVLRDDRGRRLPVTVIANAFTPPAHDPAAPGVHGWRTRGDGASAQRLAQAVLLARLVDHRQRIHPGERLIVLGDFEAAEFGDGHADVLNLIVGTPTPGRGRDGASLQRLSRLTNLTASLPASERYTVVREGNAQAVDHVLISAALFAADPKIEIARVNADFGEDNASDPTVPMRVSAHDPVVLVLDLEP